MFSLILQSRKALVGSAVLVSVVALTGRLYAAERMPAMAATAERGIQDTQKQLPQVDQQIMALEAKLSLAQGLREQLKTSNAVNLGILKANCYDFDWKKGRAVKMKQCPEGF